MDTRERLGNIRYKCKVSKEDSMVEKVYTFYSSDRERDNAEAQKYWAMATEKAPALEEAIKFVFDGCRGLNSEITEKTLDDAFDCVIYRDKYFIYAGGAPSDQKKAMADEAETSRKLVKEAFKSGLKVKRG